MEKLLAIFLLGVSLPAIASQVDLLCTITSTKTGKITHQKRSFDNDRNFYTRTNEDCQNERKKTFYDCSIFNISDVEFSYDNYDKLNPEDPDNKERIDSSDDLKERIRHVKIDRVDGSFRSWETGRWNNGTTNGTTIGTGNCVPFKSAF